VLAGINLSFDNFNGLICIYY